MLLSEVVTWCFECKKNVLTCEHETFLRFGNGHPFEPDPRFVNHMCHWAPWAEHYRASEDREKAILAYMLGSSLGENARLLKRANAFDSAYSALLWAFVSLVDRLCPWCARKPVPFGEKDTPSLRNAWASIQQLNEWRKENKLNIKAVDLS